MRVRIVQLEGTPEEFAAVDLEALLAGSDTPVLAPADLPAAVAQLLDEVGSWPNVLIHDKRPASRHSPYLRATRIPRNRGAFLYVYPGRLRCQFRLEGSTAEGCEFATTRQVKLDNPYEVVLRPLTPDSLDEARRLARLAYDRAG